MSADDRPVHLELDDPTFGHVISEHEDGRTLMSVWFLPYVPAKGARGKVREATVQITASHQFMEAALSKNDIDELHQLMERMARDNARLLAAAVAQLARRPLSITDQMGDDDE